MTAPRLHAELTGPDGAPVLVLANSLGTTTAVWDAQADALRAHFRMLRFDLRGHGRPPVPAGPYSVDDLGHDLLGLLDRYRLDRVSLCGLSLGGMAALWVAANAPGRVDRLAVCCTSGYVGPELAAAYAERAARVRAHGLAPIADTVVARWFTAGFRRREPDTVARFAAGLLATPAEGYAGCCEALATMDLRSALPAITAPALVVAGGADEALPAAHGAALAAAVPGSELVVIPDAAHLAPVEAPAAVTAAVLGHLTG